MMVDGKYTDETKTGSAWAVSWISGNYFNTGVPATSANADKNNARGGISAKGGGRGICPMGWHIPTLREWAELLNKVEGDGSGTLFSDGALNMPTGTDVGIKLKAPIGFPPYDGTVVDGSWNPSPYNGIDSYGFSILSSGSVEPADAHYDHMGSRSHQWSSTSHDQPGGGVVCFLHEPGARISCIRSKARSLSIRCLKDE
jgi:uncharacterized protein (TIGR02145 family)